MALILEKYILYGASFNPPHVGHFSAISQMLEEYDHVIVFPYPKKFSNGKMEDLPPIKQRMAMLEIFLGEYFPQIKDRLILTDLATELIKSKKIKGMPHTYDYLQYAKSNIPEGSDLSVCLGFDAKNELRKENFHKEIEIEKEFGVFRLEEENKIKSEDLRKFFSNHKNLATAKDERYIRYAVGDGLAEHIFKNNLYGVSKKIIKENNLENKIKNKLKLN
jgi:cytidyltransferase-like protein